MIMAQLKVKPEWSAVAVEWFMMAVCDVHIAGILTRQIRVRMSLVTTNTTVSGAYR